jgi:hypothetical protein
MLLATLSCLQHSSFDGLVTSRSIRSDGCLTSESVHVHMYTLSTVDQGCPSVKLSDTMVICTYL